MANLIRKLVGLIRVSLAWQVLWLMIWMLFFLAVGILDPDSIDPGEGIAMACIFALAGLVSGAAFALILAIAETGRLIDKLSLGRAAMWGILGAAAFPLLIGKYNQVVPLCPVGMAIALVLVAMARRGAASGNASAVFAWVWHSLEAAMTPVDTAPSI